MSVTLSTIPSIIPFHSTSVTKYKLQCGIRFPSRICRRSTRSLFGCWSATVRWTCFQYHEWQQQVCDYQQSAQGWRRPPQRGAKFQRPVFSEEAKSQQHFSNGELCFAPAPASHSVGAGHAFFWDTVFHFSVPDTCQHIISSVRSFLHDVVYAWKTSSDIPAPFSIARDSVGLLRADGAAFSRFTNISLFPPHVVVAVPFFFPPIMQIPQSTARGIYQPVIVGCFH
ncbi:hypothetical protein, unlikely [Trypanosoma brucei gambiense DAL972]|uniref:T. brucei spp.-specific protein n=1 Tax=Trypanosoma brucei gambiense (strain MHOM/CI/86/DAL972) TaxID=679716 RepID=D0A1H5_TRYB9|nr:hypothetical protein, unlikely [Trypanosoma brucei gambiense DAL972]CBH15117.1 hypothetical protein, unlikely [Trypanosoma brucei gambiense DAL972]|eukprot:XP_011777383.1 hypothetical protein, unlikely [Trypanosoma brucei gambiense DAL972]